MKSRLYTALLLYFAFSINLCYAEGKENYNGLLIAVIACILVSTVLLGYLLKFILSLFKITVSNKLAFGLSFIFSAFLAITMM